MMAAVDKQKIKIHATSTRLTCNECGFRVSSAITMAPPAPNNMASNGEPESANPKMPLAAPKSAGILLRAKLAKAKKRRAEKASCASGGAASCESLAKPKQAIKASKPPSAMALA
jgi:hypothetical protein